MFAVLNSPEVTETLLRIPGIRRGLYIEHKFWYEACGSGTKVGGGSFVMYGSRKGFCRYDYEPEPAPNERWGVAENRMFGCGCLKCVRNCYPDYKGTREYTDQAEMKRICDSVEANAKLRK